LKQTEYREFTDSSGVRWKAYRVQPQLISAALERLRDSLPHLASERRQPWLLFESQGERRRLSPVPSAWEEDCTDADLEHWCTIADRIPPAPARRQADEPR
jgi:hypothetical protein